MEDVIQVLVFLVIVTSVIISNYKKVKANRPGQHARQSAQESEQQAAQPDFLEFDTVDAAYTRREEFPSDYPDNNPSAYPDNNLSDSDESEPVETALHTDSSVKKYSDQPCPATESSIPTERTAVTHKREPNVRLRTRQEARKAFIYSEIFNRKYE